MPLSFQRLGQGPPVLVLPGLLGSADNWRTIARQLATNYTLYLIDHRNHGKSFHSEIMTYEAMVEDLRAFFLQEQIIDPVLIGHSMGGKVGMQFAQAHPQNLAKLVVVDIAPKAHDMSKLAAILQVLQQIPLQGVRTRAEVDTLLSQATPSLSMRQHFMKNLTRNAQGELRWSSNIPIIAKSIPSLGREVTFKAPFVKPTLFVRAAKSTYIQEQDLVQIKAMFPNYVLALIKDAGHWVNHDQPLQLVQTLMQFLAN